MKKGVVSIMESKFLGLIDLIYQLVKSSFFFWVTVIKNLLFIGLTVSFCTLLEVMEEIIAGNGLPVRRLFKEISPKYKGNKRLSFVMFGLILYLSAFVILPFPSSMSRTAASIIKFAILYLILLTFVLFTYISWILVKMDLSFKKTIMYAFYLMMKRFIRTIMLIFIMITLFYFSHMNFIFLIFLAPAIYAYSVNLILKNL
jgi:uncharacterized membrane protein YesL